MAKLRERRWGENMIKISVQFFTSNLPKGANDDKTAWASGAIHMIANKSRGLRHDMIFFKSAEELLPKIQELLQKNGVRLIKSEKFTEVDLTKTI